MTIGTTISIALWVLSILGWVGYNLFQKNKKLEDMVIRQSNFIGQLQELMSHTESVMKDLDSKIWTESEKELGAAFASLKAIQESLTSFKKK